MTLTATKNHGNATVVITNDDNASTPDTADLDLTVGDNTLTVTVTAEDTATTETYTITVTRAIAPPTNTAIVPKTWSLVPTGLNAGDEFRLLFLSSTKRDATSTNIDAYDTFIQDLAAAGHTDIQAYSDGFRAVGCTEATDARDTTGTTYTVDDKGVPIYWLNGTKVADDYEDFYDETWDDEANDKNELGTNGPDTSQESNYPFTGCSHQGTEEVTGGFSRALGAINVKVGEPNGSIPGHGPISSTLYASDTDTRPMYGLSQVFEVVDPTDATLSDLAIEVATDGQTVHLSPTFVPDTTTYTASVANRFDAVTLTATQNDNDATVAITNDADTSTPNTAEFDLIVGANTLTVTVTAENTVNTETYTITVTRAQGPPDPATDPVDWSLVPAGLSPGDEFRLLFLSSTKRDATDTASRRTTPSSKNSQQTAAPTSKPTAQVSGPLAAQPTPTPATTRARPTRPTTREFPSTG